MSYMESKMQELYDNLEAYEQQAELEEQIKGGFITESLEPIRCFKCNSVEFKDTTINTDGGHLSEFQRDCTKCGQVNGYWAYGYWQV